MTPIWYAEAEKHLGVKESPGPANTPAVVAFYEAAGNGWVKRDAVPWCAAFVGAMLERTGYRSTRLLAARSYLQWGENVSTPRVGDVVIFRRGNSRWQGHVGFYAGETARHIRVLGGNQRDAVSIARFPKSKLIGIRRPRRIAQSRTLKGAGLSLVGAGAAGGGQALGLVSQQAHEAGGLLQTLGGISQWFVVAGVLVTIAGGALAIWARLDDFKTRDSFGTGGEGA